MDAGLIDGEGVVLLAIRFYGRTGREVDRTMNAFFTQMMMETDFSMIVFVILLSSVNGCCMCLANHLISIFPYNVREFNESRLLSFLVSPAAFAIVSDSLDATPPMMLAVSTRLFKHRLTAQYRHCLYASIAASFCA